MAALFVIRDHLVVGFGEDGSGTSGCYGAAQE
jgi:hypothetical protein